VATLNSIFAVVLNSFNSAVNMYTINCGYFASGPVSQASAVKADIVRISIPVSSGTSVSSASSQTTAAATSAAKVKLNVITDGQRYDL
jgi:hypothetical protein